jgi:site-specific recombinase XerD
MSEAALATEILAPQTNTSGAVVAPVARFDDRLATAFVMKSLSAETRETYRRGIQEFFLYAGWLHPTQVTTEHVLRYRDRLIRDNRRPATVAQKLSIIRSFFSYLLAAKVVAVNPASTKLVPPPPVPTDPAGRALEPKEVRYLLSGPDRTKPEGARDYALMLVMLRLSLRLSEVCSLRFSSITTSQGAMGSEVQGQRGKGRGLAAPKRCKGSDRRLLIGGFKASGHATQRWT